MCPFIKLPIKIRHVSNLSYTHHTLSLPLPSLLFSSSSKLVRLSLYLSPIPSLMTQPHHLHKTMTPDQTSPTKAAAVPSTVATTEAEMTVYSLRRRPPHLRQRPPQWLRRHITDFKITSIIFSPKRKPLKVKRFNPTHYKVVQG